MIEWLRIVHVVESGGGWEGGGGGLEEILEAVVEPSHLEGFGLEPHGLVFPARVLDEVGEGYEMGQAGEDVGPRAVGHRVEPHLD